VPAQQRERHRFRGVPLLNKDNNVVEEEKSDWPRIAAWCFGIWSIMVPLSAAIIVNFQARAIDNQERIKDQINGLRSEVLMMNSNTAEKVAIIASKQVEVIRRLDRLEDKDGPR
jgi:hypothetical protein